MGMFDEIRTINMGHLKCHAGHPVTYWQTKSLESMMDNYFLDPTGLYLAADQDFYFEVSEGFLVQKREVKPAPITDTVCMYGTCDQCPRIQYEVTLRDNTKMNQYYRPWVEYQILFREGVPSEVLSSDIESPEAALRRIQEKRPEACLAHPLRDASTKGEAMQTLYEDVHGLVILASSKFVCARGHRLNYGSVLNRDNHIIIGDGVVYGRAPRGTPVTSGIDGQYFVQKEPLMERVLTNEALDLAASCYRCESVWSGLFNRYYVQSSYQMSPNGEIRATELQTEADLKERFKEVTVL